jgi:hypothetical protein
MERSFKCNLQNSFVTCVFDSSYGSKEIQIYVENNECEEPIGEAVYLDLQTAIDFRDHLNQEIERLKNS